jgi:hypothetical protein
MSTPPTTPEQKIQRILKLLVRLMRDKAHGQLVIVLRDGNIQRLDVQRSFLPDNLPES